MRIRAENGRPLVMGIVNCTPDSFYAGGRYPDAGSALEGALSQIAQGADILDVGGESSRPGSDYVEAGEERDRILPVIEGIRRESDIPVSVDTRKAEVAAAALDAGATMINDISALRDDPGLADLAARREVPVCLMHMKGTPRDKQKDPRYDDAVGEIAAELRAWAERAELSGIPGERIVLDPGIGFGKRQEDNLAILRDLSAFRALGSPLLIGLSRKSFLGNLLGGAPPEDRGAATLSAHVWCALQGVDILRVHDVKDTVEALTVLEELAWPG